MRTCTHTHARTSYGDEDTRRFEVWHDWSEIILKCLFSPLASAARGLRWAPRGIRGRPKRDGQCPRTDGRRWFVGAGYPGRPRGRTQPGSGCNAGYIASTPANAGARAGAGGSGWGGRWGGHGGGCCGRGGRRGRGGDSRCLGGALLLPQAAAEARGGGERSCGRRGRGVGSRAEQATVAAHFSREAGGRGVAAQSDGRAGAAPIRLPLQLCPHVLRQRTKLLPASPKTTKCALCPYLKTN